MYTPEVRPYYDLLSPKRIELIIKRFFDIAAALFVLITLAIPMLMVAVLIKIDSPGPVFYRQERITTYGKHFKIHKFRTMVNNADKIGTAVTVGDDRRITGISAKPRRGRLYEFPQAIDVLAGSMNILFNQQHRNDIKWAC